MIFLHQTAVETPPFLCTETYVQTFSYSIPPLHVLEGTHLLRAMPEGLEVRKKSHFAKFTKTQILFTLKK